MRHSPGFEIVAGPAALVGHRPQNRYPTAPDAEIARRPGIHPSRVSETVPTQPIKHDEYPEQASDGECQVNFRGN
jgi:hypothetical protein